MERQEESDPCNASPYLSYLRSHLKLILFKDDGKTNPADYKQRHPYGLDESAELLSLQPLVYSFYLKNVLDPYRSRLAEVNSPATAFCFLDISVQTCTKQYEGQEGCTGHIRRDAAVCLPNSDSTTKGKCVSCTHLQSEIENGNVKDEASIGHL
jgi:hypothetical protein